MNYYLMLYLVTSNIMGISLGMHIYKREYNARFWAMLIWAILYIILISDLN